MTDEIDGKMMGVKMERKSMMKLIWLGCTFFLIGSGNAQDNHTADKRIDSIFASYNTKTPGVAVAVVKDGKLVFSKGYGMANLAYNIPITPKTVFNIASVSKQFTAFAIYLLENDGLLSLEDNVRKYIPELPIYEKPIKIRHLLAHTSGLRDHGALQSIAGGFVNADLVTTEQCLKLLSLQKGLNFETGSTYGYCNSNYTLLAEIVHRVTGKKFTDYTNEKIFIPLRMESTTFADDHNDIVMNGAESYELQNGKYYQKSLIESQPGPSNLLTTVEDLSKWILNFEKPIVGNMKLIKAFNEPSILDNGKKVVLRVLEGDTIFVAKGQNISRENGGYFGYGGHTAGFRTFMGRYPAHHLAIVQLSNDEDNEALGGAWDIADYYIQNQSVKKVLPSVDRSTKIPKTPSETYKTNLNEFIGMFSNDELEAKYQLKVKDGNLIMSHRRLYDITLKRIGEDRFSGAGSYTFAFEINFLRNAAGAVIGFDISNWGAKNMKFVKQ